MPIVPTLSRLRNIHLTSLEKTLIESVYHGYANIILEKEFGGGYSGTRVFLILPVKTNGASDARMVTKIGPRDVLCREHDNYHEHVARALPFSVAQVREYYEQEGQAALNYVFAGGETIGQTVSLEEYYHSHTAPEVINTLTGLLDRSLGDRWYRQTFPLNESFQVQYGRHLPEDLGTITKAIFPHLSSIESDRVKIPGLAGDYPHPLKIYPGLLDKLLQGHRSLVHGDLHLRNVLVDEIGKGWLIDFAKVEERHNLFDFIKLETYIRLMALASVCGAFSWSEYAFFEQTLNQTALGLRTTPLTNPPLAKAYEVIQAVRTIAGTYVRNPHNFRDEYLTALCLYSLAMMKYYQSNGIAPTQLIFITACVAAQSLLEDERPSTQAVLDRGSAVTDLPVVADHPGNLFPTPSLSLAAPATPVPVNDPLIIAVMGTAGGVGKGMFVWCTADLLSEAGYDVAIIDLDMMSRARTLEAQRLLSSAAPPVKTVYDHFADKAMDINSPGSKALGVWDVTSDEKRDRQRGKIFVLPAAFEEDLQPFAVVANLPIPQEPVAKAVVRNIINRVQKETPSLHCILLECGAGQDLHNYAAFANAHVSFILLDPRETLFSIAKIIPRSYKKTYPEIKLYEQPIYYVLNRYLTDEDTGRVEQEGIQLRGKIPNNPAYQQYNISHPANFDVGFDDIYLAVYQTHLRALKGRLSLPTEEEIITSRWWNGFKRDRIASQILRSHSFRVQTVLWWIAPALTLVGFLAALVLEVFRYIEARVNSNSFQLNIWLLILLGLAIGGEVYMLIRQEKRRRLLLEAKQLSPEEEKRFLSKLLREEKNKSTINWLNRLYRTLEAKKFSPKTTSP